MPLDTVKTTGALKTADPSKTSGGNTKNFPVFGIVKDNIDPTCSGRIKVLLGDKSPNNSDSSDNWVTVSYLSTFFGTVKPTAGSGSDDNGTYKSNPSSYGQWNAPPDIGTKVICVFVNGDQNYGYYIGCCPEPEALHMVPAIGSSDNIVANEGEAEGYGGAVRLPVTNMNTNNPSQTNSPQFNSSPRPVHSYTASIMNQQGIIRDPIRGPISSSASREPASRVGWGVSTPGRPIYSGGYDDSTLPNNLDSSKNTQLQIVARRGGHSFVMDDGDIIGRDQLVRIRTALGHQILMSDDGQTLMILHSNGQSYIELGKEGTIDMYSTNSVNVRTQGDLNLHADQNINIHAMEDMNFQGKNIRFNSEQAITGRATQDINFSALGKYTVLAGGAIALGAGGDASLVGGGQAYVNGSKVNLNSGAPGTSPTAVPIIPLVAQTDTLYDQSKGFMAAPGKLLSICSRTPAHAPWANAGQGVDVKTSLDASANLPAPSSSAIQQTTAAAAATPAATPPAVATVASAPSTPPVSTALNTNTTSAMVASVATQAANGPLAAAAKQGAAVVSTALGNVCAVGSFALTPSQLSTAGVLKPGASTLINGLVSSGSNAVSAMTNNLFTGTPGASNLNALVQNTTAQATALVNTMQQAQTALGSVGAITGAESPAQVAGLVTAAATCGVGATIAAVQTINGTVSQLATASGVGGVANSVSNAVGGAVGGVEGALAGAAAGVVNSAVGTLNNAVGGAISQATGALNTAQSALNAIGAGSAAAGLASSIGGLGGIASALTAMGNVPSLANLLNQAEGVAASAFNAIKNSFKPLKAGVPQNLTAIAKANAASAAATASQSSQLGSSLLGAASGSIANTLNSAASLAGGLSSIAGAANSIGISTSGISGIASSVSGALSAASSTIGSVSSAVGLLNNSVGGITGSVTQATTSLSTLASTLSATPNTITTTIGGITGVASSISGAVAGATSVINTLNPTISGIQSAINSVSAIAGAGPTISSGGLSSLAASASSIQSGGAASIASSLASGMSNLPGGISTAGSIINNAVGAVNTIPGLGSISDAINSAQTTAMSGITSSLSGLTGGSLGSTIGGALNSAQNQLNGLTALASAGLSVGAIAQLQSSIASLASGGPSTIKLPTLGVNTTDRTSITSQISNVIGDLGIPKPNFVGGISQSVQDQVDALIANADQGFKIMDKMQGWDDKIDAARKAYEAAQATLPAGDPGIDSAYTAYMSLFNDPTYISLSKQLDDLSNAAAIDGGAGAASTAAATSSTATNATAATIAAADATGTSPSISAVSNLLESVTGGSPTTGLASVTGSITGLANALPNGAGSSTLSTSALGALATSAGSLSSDFSTLNATANSLSQISNNTLTSVMSGSSVQALQTAVSANLQSISNSISGITGPTLGT